MKETILIIEDEEDIRALLSSLLESEGYHIITASNGREGIAMISGAQPGSRPHRCQDAHYGRH